MKERVDTFVEYALVYRDGKGVSQEGNSIVIPTIKVDVKYMGKSALRTSLKDSRLGERKAGHIRSMMQ